MSKPSPNRISAWIKAFMAAFACVMLLSGCVLIPKEEPALKPPLVKPAKSDFQTAPVKVGDIQKTVEGVAEFQPVVTHEYQYEGSGGTLHKILVSSGDTVKKGDVLVQLEVGDLDLQVKYKLLALKKAKLKLTDDIRKGQNRLLDIDRLQVQIAQMEYDKTSKQYNAQQLVAQEAGTVTYVSDAKPGDHVDPYQILVSVADTHNLRLEYNAADSSDLIDVKVGQPVEVTLKDKNYEGKVVQTPASAPFTDNQKLAEKYQSSLYITMNQMPSNAQLGGMADIKIITKEKKNTLIIPAGALHDYLGRSFVQVLSNGRLREVDVQTGIKTSTDVEILKGLRKGQMVVEQ